MIKNIGSGSINSSHYSNGITKLKISPFSNVRTKGQCKISEKELIKKLKNWHAEMRRQEKILNTHRIDPASVMPRRNGLS